MIIYIVYHYDTHPTLAPTCQPPFSFPFISFPFLAFPHHYSPARFDFPWLPFFYSQVYIYISYQYTCTVHIYIYIYRYKGIPVHMKEIQNGHCGHFFPQTRPQAIALAAILAVPLHRDSVAMGRESRMFSSEASSGASWQQREALRILKHDAIHRWETVGKLQISHTDASHRLKYPQVREDIHSRCAPNRIASCCVSGEALLIAITVALSKERIVSCALHFFCGIHQLSKNTA